MFIIYDYCNYLPQIYIAQQQISFLEVTKMVRAWYMDDDPTDQRNEHHKNPPHFITLEELHDVSGVEYFKVKVKAQQRKFVVNCANFAAEYQDS